MTMAASVVLAQLPRDARGALEKAARGPEGVEKGMSYLFNYGVCASCLFLVECVGGVDLDGRWVVCLLLDGFDGGWVGRV